MFGIQPSPQDRNVQVPILSLRDSIITEWFFLLVVVMKFNPFNLMSNKLFMLRNEKEKHKLLVEYFVLTIKSSDGFLLSIIGTRRYRLNFSTDN